jgi:hypothetical protein
VSDFDNPWKEALERFLPAFLAFFFPAIHDAIDWSRGYESLDKELQQVAREGEIGLRRDGTEAWVLIHIEIQSQPDDDFPERMFVYHYRIYDRFRRPVVSLAVLGDDRPQWRPRSFGYALWGCRMRLRFPVVKLLDYGQDLAGLEAQANPFGLVVLAHLQTAATRQDPPARKGWKTRLVKGLLDRGLDAATIRQLFRLIDWMMDLPQELEREFSQEIRQYEEEKKMPYVTSIERLGIEKGLEEGLKKGREEGEAIGLRKGIALAVKIKFGAAASSLLPLVDKVSDLTVLRTLHDAIPDAATMEDLRKLFE